MIRCAPLSAAWLLALCAGVHAAERGVLSLDEAIRRALRENPVYLGLKSGTELAELDLENARSVFATRLSSTVNSSDRTGAELGSLYEARVSKLMQSGSSVGLGFSNSRYGHDSLSELKLSYTLPFFDNPAREGLLAVDRARLEVVRRERLLAIGAQELALQVTGAYYDSVLALARLRLAGSSRDLANALARVTALRRATGLSSPFDLRKAEVRVAEAGQFERTAGMAAQRNRHRLATLIGAGPAEDFAIEERIPGSAPAEAEPLDPEVIETDVLVNRIEFASMREELRLLEQRVREPRSRLPPVDVTLQVALVDEGHHDSGNLSLDDPRFGIGFNMMLDRAASMDRERARWRLEFRALSQALRAFEDQVRAEARETLLTREESDGAWRVARLRVELAEEQFRMTELRYRAGTATTEEALEAEQFLAEARLAELEARVAFHMAERRLGLMTGRFEQS